MVRYLIPCFQSSLTLRRRNNTLETISCPSKTSGIDKLTAMISQKQTPVQVFNDGVFIRVKEYSSIITYNCRKLLSKSHLCNAPIEVMECGCDNDNLATFWIKQSYGWRCRHGHHFMDKCGRAYLFKSNSWEGRKFIFEDGEFYWNIDDWRTLVSR